MLASACPGWVCYAEKTHGQLVLPHIASAKSPQAIMGSLVKRVWGRGRWVLRGVGKQQSCLGSSGVLAGRAAGGCC